MGNLWWFWAMRHRLAEPCHDRKLHSTDFIYSFDVGKTNQLLRKQNSDTEPQSHNAYSIVLSSVLFIVILPVHSMYWPTRLQRIMLQIFPRRVRNYDTGLRSTLNLPMALMGLHTRLIVSAEYYEVYIILRYLYMWLHFDIYIDVLCVPAYWSRDGTETQRLDRLRSGRYTI